MDKLTFKEWSILSDVQTITYLSEDQEFSMARGELKTAKSAIDRLMRHLKGEGNLEAWVQSKITKAAEYLDTVADHMDSGEDETEDVSEMISTSVETGRRFRDVSSPEDQRELEKENAKRKKEKEEKYKKSLAALRDETRKKGIRFYDKKGSGYIRDGKKQYDESVEILDANGNIFAHIVDIIKGSDYKFKSFTQPITEDAVEELESGLKKLKNTSYDSIDKLMRGIMKEHGMTAKELHNAFVKKHNKTPDDWIKDLTEEKRGLWDNIHARRKKGLPPKKPGDKGYPKTLDIEEGIEQARKNVGASKCWTGKKLGNPPTKIKGGKEVPNCVPVKEESEVLRYCPKCKKNETMKECRYGEKYWKMFSLPASLAPNPYDPNEIHPANEGMSFEIGGGHKQAQKQAKIRNLAKGTSNPNEKSAALRRLSGPSLPLADSVIQPGQLTNEDYQRIQSTGNVYTILFSWRGRPMMNLQLFFPNMKRPSKDEVKTQIEKLYPGAVIMQWYPSPTDPSKPIVVIQGK
jgi:hypothetical protein